MSIAYVLISAAVLFLLLVVDNHPPQAVPENETPELIQMLAVAGLGLGAVGAHLRAMVTSSEPG
jgi:H+/Cl- antiporter ClcA